MSYQLTRWLWQSFLPAPCPPGAWDLPRDCQPRKVHVSGSELGSFKFWVPLYLPALQDLEVWVCAPGKVHMEAPGRAQQSRFQLHMAGFSGSAPKGSSGREVLPLLCLEPVVTLHPIPHPGRVGFTVLWAQWVCCVGNC